uniref:Uncharacterized protein n=1 Tax=Toxoplasma gondii COUG TaxID=1074873 RepID=A0A2G8YBH4_TOXGO|nr:hypothetical protein TGCOUG_248130 [Toxoplasma gondii COUG]
MSQASASLRLLSAWSPSFLFRAEADSGVQTPQAAARQKGQEQQRGAATRLCEGDTPRRSALVSCLRSPSAGALLRGLREAERQRAVGDRRRAKDVGGCSQPTRGVYTPWLASGEREGETQVKTARGSRSSTVCLGLKTERKNRRLWAHRLVKNGQSRTRFSVSLCATSSCPSSASSSGPASSSSSASSSSWGVSSYLWGWASFPWNWGRQKTGGDAALEQALFAGVQTPERPRISLQLTRRKDQEDRGGDFLNVAAVGERPLRLGETVCAEKPLLIGCSEGVSAAAVFDLPAFFSKRREDPARPTDVGSCASDLRRPLSASPSGKSPRRQAQSSFFVPPFMDLLAAALLVRHKTTASPSASADPADLCSAQATQKALLSLFSLAASRVSPETLGGPGEGAEAAPEGRDTPQRQLAKELHAVLRPDFEESVEDLETLISLLHIASLPLPSDDAGSREEGLGDERPVDSQRPLETSAKSSMRVGFFPLLVGLSEEPSCRPNVVISFTEEARKSARSQDPRPSLSYVFTSDACPSSECLPLSAASLSSASSADGGGDETRRETEGETEVAQKGVRHTVAVRVSPSTSLESLYAPTFMREARRRRRQFGTVSRACRCERCTEAPELCRSFNCDSCAALSSSNAQSGVSGRPEVPPIVCPTGPSKSRALADTPMRCLRCGREPSVETKEKFEAAEKSLFMSLMTAAHVGTDARRRLPSTAFDALADAAVGSDTESRALIADTHFLRVRQFTEGLYRLLQQRSERQETGPQRGLPVRSDKPELLRRRCDSVIEATRSVVGPHPDEARLLECLALVTGEEEDFQRAYRRRQEFYRGDKAGQCGPPYKVWKERLLARLASTATAHAPRRGSDF